MLGAVIFKHTVQLFIAGTQKHIPQKNHHLERAFQDDPGPAPHGHHLVDQPGQERGQKGKQEEGQHHTGKSGTTHQHVLYSGTHVRFSH